MLERKISLFLVFVIALASCNLPTNAPTGDDGNVPPPAPTAVNSPIPPTATPIPSATPPPTDTPPPTLTSTPTIPIAWPKDVGVNCRYGPSVDWLVVGALLVEQTAEITGKNAAGTWWYVKTPNAPGNPCWVSGSVTNTAGNLANLPIIPTPDATVTKVTLKKPDNIHVGGCVGPILPMELKGSIEVNGPVQVKWHFETEQGGALPDKTLNFDSVGEKSVSDNSYTPPLVAGDYWVKLVVTSPNGKVAEKSYKITC